jgi:UDP-N-acetylglucosamine 2-epimerase (non-hydrolysing)/GDP/UDP-N,N'-diacetylbacillosamine 2-epimerase (hydrolysing)
VTNSDALQRVKQLGENPYFVFNVGSPALEHIRTIKFLDRNELQSTLNFEFLSKNLLITFHPETIEESSDAELRELLKSLEKMGPDVGLIFTQANADPGSRSLDKILDEFIANHKNAAKFASLGQLKYLSLVKQVDAVVGNSSSGLYEIPSLKKPTVNIGARQEGRMKADSVIDCSARASEISDAINQALSKDCSQAINPYEGADSSGNIVSLIKQHANPELLKKKFFDLEFTISK